MTTNYTITTSLETVSRRGDIITINREVSCVPTEVIIPSGKNVTWSEIVAVPVIIESRKKKAQWKDELNGKYGRKK